MANSDAYEKARVAYEALYTEKVRAGNAFNKVDALGKARADLLSASQDYYKAIGDTSRDHEAAIVAIEKGVEQRVKAQVATTVTPPAPASAPKLDAAPKSAEAPKATEDYNKAVIELRRNFIDSLNDPTKADAAAKKESVEKSFKEARKAAGFKDDDDKAIATLRGQFEEQRKANNAAYDALTQAVEAQVNGDTNITNDTIKVLRAKYGEARQAYRKGMESPERTEKALDYFVAEARLKAAVQKQNESPSSIKPELVDQYKREYVDAWVASGADRTKAETNTDKWVAGMQSSLATPPQPKASVASTASPYDKAREAYRAAVIERVKHENVDVPAQAKAHQSTEEKAKAEFLAVQPKGVDDVASKKNVEAWKQEFEKEGKAKQIKLKLADKHPEFKPNDHSKAKDQDGKSTYERALEEMQKRFPTQEFTVLGDLAAPAGQKPAEGAGKTK